MSYVCWTWLPTLPLPPSSMRRSVSRESKSAPARSKSRSKATGRRAVSQEREQHSASSSTDDVRSFCDSISHMAGKLTRSLSIFGWQQPPQPIHTQPHPPATSVRLSSIIGLGRTYVEAANPPQTSAMTVKFDCERDVQELSHFGKNVCIEKVSKRGAKNPWRQYGALRKLHEIGGNVPEKMDKKHRKKGNAFNKVKKGSTPPHPPTIPEIVLNGGKDVTILRGLKLPCGVPGEQLAHSVAVEMQRMARAAIGEEHHGEIGGAHSTSLVLSKTK